MLFIGYKICVLIIYILKQEFLEYLCLNYFKLVFLVVIFSICYKVHQGRMIRILCFKTPEAETIIPGDLSNFIKCNIK